MNNLTLLKNILMTNNGYWLVSYEKSVILIGIPFNIKRGLKYEDISLKDVEELQHAECITNIFLNEPYPPFQRGVNFSWFRDGIPIPDDLNYPEISFPDVLSKLLTFKGKSIYEYSNFLRQLIEKSNDEDYKHKEN